jgi:hypothetical protein
MDKFWREMLLMNNYLRKSDKRKMMCMANLKMISDEKDEVQMLDIRENHGNKEFTFFNKAEEVNAYVKNGTSKALPDKTLKSIMSAMKKDAIMNDYYIMAKDVNKGNKLQNVGNPLPLGGEKDSGHSLEQQLYENKLSEYKNKSYLEQ